MAKKACLAATTLGVCLITPAAAEWSGYASVGSDYVFRGVSLLESGPALQAGAEARFGDYLIAGISAARVDRQWVYQQDVPRHLQLDFYVGADLRCGAQCRARLLISRYAFPGPQAQDWSEATAAVTLFDRVGGSIAWSPRGLGSRQITRTFETWLQQPLSRSTSVEFGYGRVLIEDLDYWYARAGISRRVDRVVLDLTAYCSDRGLNRFVADEHSRRVVLTVSTAF